MNAVILYRIDDRQRMHRYAAWTCSRIYSGSGASCASGAALEARGDAQAALDKQRRVKERRGYYNPAAT